MTKVELIAKQQLEIEMLKTQISNFQHCYSKIKSELVCIGGPLNDNVLGYNINQLKPFFRIHRYLGNID